MAAPKIGLPRFVALRGDEPTSQYQPSNSFEGVACVVAGGYTSPNSRGLTCITTDTCQTNREILGQINCRLMDNPGQAVQGLVLGDVHHAR